MGVKTGRKGNIEKDSVERWEREKFLKRLAKNNAIDTK